MPYLFILYLIPRMVGWQIIYRCITDACWENSHLLPTCLIIKYILKYLLTVCQTPSKDTDERQKQGLCLNVTSIYTLADIYHKHWSKTQTGGFMKVVAQVMWWERGVSTLDRMARRNLLKRWILSRHIWWEKMV